MAENSATESRRSDLPRLDELDTISFLRLMNELDVQVPLRVGEALEDVARAVDLAVASLQRGGRLIYVGAGSSGRLAVADAAEVGPTFGFDGIVAVMAGGAGAITDPSEGKEDDRQAGREALLALCLSDRDAVLGVSAGGRAPFVRAALDLAREVGAASMLLTGNRVDDFQGDCLIFIDTGPEIVRGSTRLKAGTAAKLALNMISTASMVRLGRVVGGEMVFMRSANAKLEKRAATMLSDLLRLPPEAAAALLREADGLPAAAILMHLCRLDRAEAMRMMETDPLAVRRAFEQRNDPNL